MTWRAVASVEWRRTGGPVVVIALLLVGVVLFASKQRPFYAWADWSSTYAQAVGWLNDSGIVLGPVVATVAAWVGGRERRCRLGELLASTPRASWQRRSTTLVAVGTALMLGWMLQAAVVLGAVFPTVSYSGGRWLWTLLLVALGVLFSAGLGFAVGRRLPGRLVPPAVGLVLYVGFAIPLYVNDQAWTSLVPVASSTVPQGDQLRLGVIPFAVSWLVALTGLVVLVGVGRARQWRLGAAAAVVATVSAVVLTALTPATAFPDGTPGRRTWVEVDPAALAQVCSDPTVGAVVCVQRQHAGLLPTLAPVARRELARISVYVPLRRAVEEPAAASVPGGVLPLADLAGMSRPYRSGADPRDIAQWTQNTVVRLTADHCDDLDGASVMPAWYTTSTDTAQTLLDPTVAAYDQRAAALSKRLRADPAAARVWITAYLSAAGTCDRAELQRLAGA